LILSRESIKAKGRSMSKAEQEKFKAPILARYEAESSAYFSTSRLWDDGILDPVDTRTALGLGISMSLNAPIPEHRFGVFRM
jgi:acetyl-CoA carboxylase carboxyltransferase component